jgi:hypothetical protein
MNGFLQITAGQLNAQIRHNNMQLHLRSDIEGYSCDFQNVHLHLEPKYLQKLKVLKVRAWWIIWAYSKCNDKCLYKRRWELKRRNT